MRKKTNIYDSDDADRSKRLSFTPEERAARAQQKAEVLGQKLERAEKQIPKKKKIRLQKELDPEKSRMKHTLRFEEVEKQRGKEILPKKAGRRMVQTASAAVHSKMYQVEEENVGTKAAHRTELATEATATMAAHAARVHHQNAPYKKVEKLQQQVNQANVNAAYRAAVRDNPELQTNNVKRFVQKQRIKRQYAKEYRKAQKAGSKGSAAAKKAKDAVSSTGQAVITAIKNHKGGLVVIGALVLLVIMVFSSLSSCSVMMEGAMGSAAYRRTKAADKPAFRTAHEADLLLHEAAKRAFDAQGVKKLPTVKVLQAEYTELLTKKKAAYEDYKRLRKENQDVQAVKSNVDTLLRIEEEPQEKKQEQHR